MIDEDFEAWEIYPQYRWIFNKLEVALKFGYDAGPACVPIKKVGWYIVRPIYNLYGMGIGAEKKYFDPKVHGKDMTNHKYIPPGYFWCEYLEGKHYSIDYKKISKLKWEPICVMVGIQNENNLTKFEKWIKIDIPTIKLPKWIYEIECEYLNIEFKGDNPFEIHLRSGHDNIWNYPIGTEIIPVWEGQTYTSNYEFVSNSPWRASGYLKDVRIGYLIKKPKKG